ncbi:MAG: hypothetical protein Tp172SUR151031_31 [Prokaryotic dsDNA virus sp.]|nr:MAG: hypothetical protein Tp172SUR151031_31 [Prokaryotic dsDNA virus sp.]|tara:strand:+ start:5670 stop:5867 length:198 start_codon:yes stop_codon:yes gene_type:complete
MFKAILVVCKLASADCFVIEDAYGPYDTKQDCQKRVFEMLQDFKVIVKPPYRDVLYYCKTGYEVT